MTEPLKKNWMYGVGAAALLGITLTSAGAFRNTSTSNAGAGQVSAGATCAVKDASAALASGDNCEFTGADKSKQKSPATGEVVSAPTPGSKVVFADDFEAAMDTAGQDARPVMVKFYTDWCGVCRKMDSEVFTKVNVQEALQDGFVAVKVNPEKSDGGARLAEQYRVEGFPTMVFLNADGSEIHRVVGYRDPTDLIAEFNTAIQAG
jgi:thiol:disulfide interchange protein